MKVKVYLTPEGAFWRCPHCSYNMSEKASNSHRLSVVATCHMREAHNIESKDIQIRIVETERVPF